MPDATSCLEYRRDSVQAINLGSLAIWPAGRSRSWPARCLGDLITASTLIGSIVFLKRLDNMLINLHAVMVSCLSICMLACVDGVRSDGTCTSLSPLGPNGMMSFKLNWLGRWGETDMVLLPCSPSHLP